MNFQDVKSVQAIAVCDTESVSSADSWEHVPVKTVVAKPAEAVQAYQLRRLNDIKTYFPVIWNEVQRVQ
jgi:hypothetical protein